jgi:hypothetical protein
MAMEFSKDDLTLLDMLLSQAEVETRVEIHHCRTYEFKDYLKKREEGIRSLLTKIQRAMAGYDAEHPEKGIRCVLACDERGASA